jgi:hypothetical protein
LKSPFELKQGEKRGDLRRLNVNHKEGGRTILSLPNKGEMLNLRQRLDERRIQTRKSIDMNFLKKLFSRKTKSERLRTDASQVFATLETMEKKGLLLWDTKNRRLFIAEPLAILMIQKEQGWIAFLQNTAYWQYYKEVQDSWDSYIRNEELKAVRRAKRKYAVLTKMDIERIRRQRRSEVQEAEKNAIEIKPFELFIIGDNYEGSYLQVSEETTNTAKESKEATNHVIAVGDYNPITQQVNMALWKDVQSALQEINSEKESMRKKHSDIDALAARITEG